MSINHDQLEDSYIYNEYTQNDVNAAPRKKNVCFCKCLLWNPCCKYCASKLLEYELKKTINDVNAPTNAFGQKDLKKQDRLKIETGSLQAIKEMHSQTEKDKEYVSMEELRQKHKLKVQIPKLKTKNAKNQSIAQRRTGLIDQEPFLQIDPNIISTKTQLDIMEQSYNLVPSIINHLVKKSNIKTVGGTLQRKMSHFQTSPSLIGSSSTSLRFIEGNLPKNDRPMSMVSMAYGTGSLARSRAASVSKPTIEYAKLTQFREMIVKELEKNWELTLPYIKNWIQTFKKHRKYNKTKGSIDRWVVVMYTSSAPGLDDLSEFGCLFIRELFHRYHVAYEEKDISVEKFNYKEELQNRLNGGSVYIPYIFVSNFKLGGSRVVWALHRLNLFQEVFDGYMMSPETYNIWRTQLKPIKEEMLINVPLKDYPSLEVVSQGQKAKLNSEKMSVVQQGKELVKLSKEKWKNLTADELSELDLFMYVMTKESIKSCFRLMDSTFWSVLCPSLRYSDNVEMMRMAIAKIVKGNK